MNPVVIFLGVIVLILVYYLYVNYISNTTSLSSKADLKTSNPAIPYSKLQNRDSSNYAYGVWIYVNTWTSNNVKTLISRGSDFSLTIDQTTPKLYCKINSITGDASSNIIITNNFPIQKWTHVIVSVNSQIVDIYLDGKLIISQKLNYVPKVSTNDIALGDSNNPDIILAKLQRWPKTMDPQTAWNYYLQGNGVSNSTNYNVKLSVLQDNVEQKQFSLY